MFPIIDGTNVERADRQRQPSSCSTAAAGRRRGCCRRFGQPHPRVTWGATLIGRVDATLEGPLQLTYCDDAPTPGDDARRARRRRSSCCRGRSWPARTSTSRRTSRSAARCATGCIASTRSSTPTSSASSSCAQLDTREGLSRLVGGLGRRARPRPRRGAGPRADGGHAVRPLARAAGDRSRSTSRRSRTSGCTRGARYTFGRYRVGASYIHYWYASRRSPTRSRRRRRTSAAAAATTSSRCRWRRAMMIPSTAARRRHPRASSRARGDGDVDWRGGRVFSLVYHAGRRARASCSQRAHALYASANLLEPDGVHGPRSSSSATSSRCAARADARPRAPVGTVTSGGTESILCAVAAYRDRARRERPWELAAAGARRAATIHPAFDKAAHYFGVRLVKVAVGADLRADVRAMAQRDRPADDRRSSRRRRSIRTAWSIRSRSSASSRQRSGCRCTSTRASAGSCCRGSSGSGAPCRRGTSACRA